MDFVKDGLPKLVQILTSSTDIKKLSEAIAANLIAAGLSTAAAVDRPDRSATAKREDRRNNAKLIFNRKHYAIKSRTI